MRTNNPYATLYKIALKFIVPLSSVETYKLIVKEAIRLTGANDGTLFIRDQDFVIRAFSTLRVDDQPQPRKNGNIITVFKQQKTIILSGERLHKQHPEIDVKQTKSIIILPLVHSGLSIGVLALRSKKVKFFTKKKVVVLAQFLDIVTLAIPKTQQFDQIKRSLESRDYFISLASHELKTPLTSVMLYTNIIERAVKKHTVPSAKWVNSLSTEATRMTHLFSELLEIEKIKTGRLTFIWKTRHMLDIVQSAVSRFSLVHPKRKVRLQIDTDRKHDIVICDAEKLLQVFTNVLNNAAKFSSDKDEIVVRIKHTARQIRVDITDKGKGISSEDLPKIFNKFYKGTDHTVQGMGLGLFLSKHVMDTHRGNIKIHSELKKGTTVQVSMPRID